MSPHAEYQQLSELAARFITSVKRMGRRLMKAGGQVLMTTLM